MKRSPLLILFFILSFVVAHAQPLTLGLADSRYSQPIGVRLKGAAQSDLARSAFGAPVLMAPRAWTSTTAYYAGEVVQNGGNMYQCYAQVNSATTAPTSTSFTTGSTDGTGYWIYLGPAFPAANLPDCPTVTQGTGNGSGSVTNGTF